MEAYDLKALAESCKPDGLDLTEEAARKLFLRVSAWLKASAKLSATVVDDIAFGFLEKFEPVVLAKIDQINGKMEG